MQANVKQAAAAVAALALAACQSTADFNYREISTSEKVENIRVVHTEFNETWDKLIKNLSAEFFVINNVEKASRIINVSFSTSTPSEFIDCGQTHRSYTNGRGNTETFDYATADAAKYRTASENGAYSYEVHRKTNLEGRANIYVAPSDNNVTEIAVNVRYIFDIDADIYQIHNLYGKFLPYAPQKDHRSESFDTTKPLDVTDQWGRFTCRALGTLEKRILDAAE